MVVILFTTISDTYMKNYLFLLSVMVCLTSFLSNAEAKDMHLKASYTESFEKRQEFLGYQALKRGDYDIARYHFERLKKADDKNIAVFFLLADVKFKEKNFYDAYFDFKECLRLNEAYRSFDEQTKAEIKIKIDECFERLKITEKFKVVCSPLTLIALFVFLCKLAGFMPGSFLTIAAYILLAILGCINLKIFNDLVILKEVSPFVNVAVLLFSLQSFEKTLKDFGNKDADVSHINGIIELNKKFSNIPIPLIGSIFSQVTF